jgi:lysophospholipase L1-like esterase
VRWLSLQVLVTIGLLLALEAAARLISTVHQNLTQEPTWFAYAADLGWERQPHFTGLDDCGEHRAFGDQGFLVQDVARLQEPGPRKFRALFLGDSNTYGYCLDADDTFVAATNRRLADTHSLNLGVSGYSSYQGYRALLHYGDRLKPDIVFVSFNYNDRRLVLDADFADSRETFERMHMAGRMSAFADLSYIFRGARYLMEKLSPPAPAMLGYVPKADLGALRPRVDAASYRANLTGMVQWARERGIAVVFLLLGDNPDQTYMLTEGVRLLSEGAHQDAIDMLEAGLDEGGDESFAMLMRLHLARAYEAVGRSAEAKRVRIVDDLFAGLHGGQPIVLDSDYHRIMRDVAAQMDVTVIDAARELGKDPSMFFDNCHFDARGHEVVSGLVVDAIEKAKASAGLRSSFEWTAGRGVGRVADRKVAHIGRCGFRRHVARCRVAMVDPHARTDHDCRDPAAVVGVRVSVAFQAPAVTLSPKPLLQFRSTWIKWAPRLLIHPWMIGALETQTKVRSQ